MEWNARGSFFRLTLLGYQYPDAEGEPYDANWLLVRVDAVGPQGAWSVADPCLLTHEVARLADWLDGTARDARTAPAVSFLEPALLFRRVEREGGEQFLRVHFGSLVHPNWAADAFTAGPETATPEDVSGPAAAGGNPRERWLDFPLAEIDLPAAAQDLRQQLKKYPRRKEI